jgi:hypothetical protein
VSAPIARPAYAPHERLVVDDDEAARDAIAVVVVSGAPADVDRMRALDIPEARLDLARIERLIAAVERHGDGDARRTVPAAAAG